MATWTPVLSGTAIESNGLATESTTHKYLKMVLTAGNPLIGHNLTNLALDWAYQTPSGMSGTWTLSHYRSDDTLLHSTNTTAIPNSASFIQQNFTFDGTDNIIANDYFQLSCVETDNSTRDPLILCYPTCTGNCQYTNTVEDGGYSFSKVKSTWTHTGGVVTTGTRLPPPPIVLGGL